MDYIRMSHIEYKNIQGGTIELMMLTDLEARNENEALEMYHESDEDWEPVKAGIYYWFCFPGCLPDSEMYGPFDNVDEAISDAQGN